jgi:hypothetical protein
MGGPGHCTPAMKLLQWFCLKLWVDPTKQEPSLLCNAYTPRMGPHLKIGSLKLERRAWDEVILDQLCHPLHWVRPPYWNMVKSHRTERNGDFSKSSVTWDLSVGPHLEIGSLQMGLMKGLEMRPSWTSCVTHSIGPGCHIGIWSSAIELRGMVTFPKAVSPGS